MTSLDFSLEGLMAQLAQPSPTSDRQHRQLGENAVLNEEKGVINRADTVPTVPDSSGDDTQNLLEGAVNCRNCQETGKPKTDMFSIVPDTQKSQVSVLSVTSRVGPLEPDPLSDAGWSTVWRERIQTHLQALEDWVWREEYDLMRTANNGPPKARALAREKLVRWYLFMLEGKKEVMA